MGRKRGAVKKKNNSLEKKVADARDFLKHNRYHGTIGQKRKEVTKALGYYMDRLQGRPLITKVPGVKYVGLKHLTPLELRDVMRITEAAHKRLRRDFPAALFLVDVKEHNIRGKRKKFSVRLRLEGPRTVILSAKQSDWDLPKALHKAIANLEQEVRHRFKQDVTPRRRKQFP